MVLRRGLIQFYHGTGPWTANRSIRDEHEQETSSICSSQCRPGSSSSGCDVLGLEPMEQHLPVPSFQSPDEGTGEAPNLQGNSSFSSTPLAQEQLVPSGSGTQAPSDSSDTPEAVTGSTEGDCLRFPLENEEPSAHDFLALATKRKFGISKESFDFMEKYKTISTQKQYGASWKKWVQYVKD